MMFPNFIHLDMKGVIPSFPELLKWIGFIADCGYNGIVWEYEDRLPWKSWPEVYRPGYDLIQWREIWEKCSELKLQIIPLVQTHGHLEWLLRHDKYSSWKENGCCNEICPQNDEAVNKIIEWLDEVAVLHPDSEFIHVGGDETWNLASCPECQKESRILPYGKSSLYIKHIGKICSHVISLGKKPMIWGDMLLKEKCYSAPFIQLPAETIIIDWQYQKTISTVGETIKRLKASGLETWGASAIRCSYDLVTPLSQLGPRIQNICAWHKSKNIVSGLIHTTWVRSTGK